MRHARESNLRDFLAVLARRRTNPSEAERLFFAGFDPGIPLLKQGVRVSDCLDYSSGRGYDEGAIVNKIVLERQKGAVAIFLKGLGKVRTERIRRLGASAFEEFEITGFEAARIVGLNSIETRRYLDDGDDTMVGYTLIEEIQGVNTNELFERLPDYRFRIRPEYTPFRDRLIKEFAGVGALCDLLHKGDRKIVQAIHPEYDANCLVKLEWLTTRPGRRAVYLIDHNHLFEEDNRSALFDIKHGRCVEIGIVSAFEEFYADARLREGLLRKYRQAYMKQWECIRANQKRLADLIAERHGKRSLEYEVFRRAIASAPQATFEAQKAALLRAEPLRPPAVTVAAQESAPSRHRIRGRPATSDPSAQKLVKLRKSAGFVEVPRPPVASGLPLITPSLSMDSLMTHNTRRFFTHDRLDLVVKYRLFAALDRGCPARQAEAMYAKHILARTGGVEPGQSDKLNLEMYFQAARRLFQSMRDRGFDPRSPIPIDQWGRLRDGAHRVACAAVLGLEVEVSCVKARFPIRQWGIDWFLAHGFSRRYVNGLLDELNLVTGYSDPAASSLAAEPRGPARLNC